MRWSAVWAIVAVGGLALGSGCQPVSIQKVHDRSSLRATGRVVPIPDETPAPDEGANPRDPDVLMAWSSRAYRASTIAGHKARDHAALEALGAVVDASDALAASRTDPPTRRDVARARHARDLINQSTRQAIRLTSGRRVRLDQAWRDDLAARGVRVSVSQTPTTWDPRRFDEFLFADDFVIQGIDHQFRNEGLGVPLIGLRRFRLEELEGRQGEEKFLMPRQVYAVTAILKVDDSPEGSSDGFPGFQLELEDPIRARTVELAGRREPMASDLTTPLAYHFIHSSLPILQEVGLLDPQWLEKLAGLYMLHPYEPGKIPVVLVHGLRSSPAAWMKVINDLRGDPVLRDRYQFWLFLYPTGTPFPSSAGKLRKAIDELRAVVDPARSDPALDQMVAVGHSMGGLISKMLVLSSGDEVWKLIGTRPFEELRATPERKETLRSTVFFEPHPSVRRVVFIATPHRGSELGDQFVGRLADRLIRLPSSLRQTYRSILAQNGPDFFTPETRAGLPSSIDELRRDNPLLMTLNRLPVGRGVVVHSIIGQKDPSLPIEQGSDGVVPYASSHLEGASTELVVEGDHGCQDSPATIQELRRILYQHLGPRQAARGVETMDGPVGEFHVPRPRAFR